MPFRDPVRALPFVIATAMLACHGDDLLEPSTGTLEITTATTGVELDPDGYTVQVDGEPPRSIGAAGQLSADAATGEHSVRLDGIAANCAVEGDNPRQVVLTSAATSTVSFSVTCHSTSGTLVVTSSSRGFFPDPDGYVVTVDGESRGALGASAQLTLDGLSGGVHQIGLSGLIANCRVQGENPRPQEIVAGADAAVAFEVECAAPAIAFRSTRGDNRSSIHLINPDGSGLVRIPSDRDEYRPVWSPDGRRLAFVGSSDLYIMTPGAGDRTRLFQNSQAGGVRGSVSMASWSPDGTMVAFGVALDSVCGGLPCIREQLWKVNSDGTGLRKLAGGSRPARPAWSPDGRTIVFGNDQGVATIEPDGGGLKQLTVPLLPQPEEATWSPDGTRLVFTLYFNGRDEIFTMNPDGTGLVGLTPEGGSDAGPKWSPDGSRIVFRMDLNPVGRSGLAVMNADGSGRTVLFADAELHKLEFAWSPDGRKIAFTVSIDFEIGDDDVYVVNVDGSGLRNLTRNPAGDMEPSWAFR